MDNSADDSNEKEKNTVIQRWNRSSEHINKFCKVEIVKYESKFCKQGGK